MRKLHNKADYVELNKSYRSTYEFINFAKQIQNIDVIEPILRHGNEPVLIQCSNRQDEIERLKTIIHDFEDSRYNSLGIIVKTEDAAKMLYNMLLCQCNINFISSQSSNFKNGVSIISIKMSKGLEFDKVVVFDADNINYVTEYDKNLLYIACTRAIHELTLMYIVSLSSLIR